MKGLRYSKGGPGETALLCGGCVGWSVMWYWGEFPVKQHGSSSLNHQGKARRGHGEDDVRLGPVTYPRGPGEPSRLTRV